MFLFVLFLDKKNQKSRLHKIPLKTNIAQSANLNRFANSPN